MSSEFSGLKIDFLREGKQRARERMDPRGGKKSFRPQDFDAEALMLYGKRILQETKRRQRHEIGAYDLVDLLGADITQVLTLTEGLVKMDLLQVKSRDPKGNYIFELTSKGSKFAD